MLKLYASFHDGDCGAWKYDDTSLLGELWAFSNSPELCDNPSTSQNTLD
jgi:hypothetical protein